MNEPLILAIDCGTQSIRALLFDKKGNLLKKEKAKFKPYFSVKPGWAEQDPNIYWKNLCKICLKMKNENYKQWDRIEGVVVTTLRDSCVNLDKDGNVLRPIILWLDQRMAECKESLPILGKLAFKAVGMKEAVEVARKKTKSNWIKENEPEIWDKTYKYLLLSGFLTYKLTGDMVDSVASQIGHIPFDYKNKKWLSKTSIRWPIFSIEEDKLPRLVEPGDILGYITKEASELSGIKEGLPVISTGSDKGCETLGSGCVNSESGSISLGTTCTIQTTSKEYFEPLKFMPSYPAVVPGYYNAEVEIFRGYWMISWFKSEFAQKELIEAKEKNIAPEELLNERLNHIPPGSHGLILQPFWGPGLKNPEAKGSIIGFGDVHTRVHIYRAIIEGINYALIDGIEKIERKSGNNIKRITVSGGGSQSDAICQITADMFNRPVYRTQTHEASGLGAAVVGFVGIGVYNSYEKAVREMVHYTSEFKPTEKNVGIYRDLYENVYKKIYPRLKDLYKDIKDITGYPEY
ncbi:FGGY-family carbohydrate kinase [Dethiothermospora halolimnae]|uniref:FGGY-family carbohydrate kinase n=1 Tax=Dethiothermospora halolimnae TaxID=3114390 RepID=UPI003CCB73C8